MLEQEKMLRWGGSGSSSTLRATGGGKYLGQGKIGGKIAPNRLELIFISLI